MRRSLVITLVLLAVAFLFVGGPSLLFSPSTEEATPEANEPEPEIVSFEDSDSGFWPYLSTRQAHEKRSPINVLVRGDSEDVVQLLSEHGEGDWGEVDNDHFEADELVGGTDNETATSTDDETVDNESPPDEDPTTATDETNETAIDSLRPISPTDIPWSQADGATRYAYLDPGPDEDGYWTTETMQLEDGEYYGYRYHIRAYESPDPDDQWLVMQTHSEHFDWFTLRHHVDGSEAAQTRLERDLMAIPAIDVQEDVQRIYLGNGRSVRANGWATKVDLTTIAMGATMGPLLIGLATNRKRHPESKDGADGDDGESEAGDNGENEADEGYLDRLEDTVASHLTEADRDRLRAAVDRLDARHLILAATIVLVILGVRIAGIALDRTFDSLTAHAVAALLYPFIAVGLPAATYVIASGLERRLDAAVAASLSLAVAIWLDYGLLGVDVFPVDIVLQRMLVVVSLGLVAGGAARRATRETRFNGLLLAGTAMWVLVLAGTLLGYF